MMGITVQPGMKRRLILLLILLSMIFAAATLNWVFSLANARLVGPTNPVLIGITTEGFVPDPATAAVDQVVEWTNLTTDTVTLTSYPPCASYLPLLASEAITPLQAPNNSTAQILGNGDWMSGPIAPGGTFSRTFGMTGTITVYQDCGRGITGTLHIVSTVPSPTSTPVPVSAYINATPNCWTPGNPNTQIELTGGNWPSNPLNYAAIHVELRDRWNHGTSITTIPEGHNGTFGGVMVNVGSFSPTNAPYTFIAQAANGTYATYEFDVPCPSGSPTATPPAGIDLIIVSQPTLVFTSPIVAGEPVTVTYLITNVGNTNATDLFYVDTFFDPMDITSTTVPISYSVRYVAVTFLAAGETKAITMTVPDGFMGTTYPLQTVMGMVDSVRQISETNETNNITQPVYVPVVTPTPGPGCVAGVARYFDGQNWIPAAWTDLYLVENGMVVAETTAGPTGYFAFTTGCLTGMTYTVAGCYETTTSVYSGIRPGIISPNAFVDLFMTQSSSCPFP